MKIRIGDKIVEATMEKGVPIIKAEVEKVFHPDGRVDVIVHVPCLQIASKKEE